MNVSEVLWLSSPSVIYHVRLQPFRSTFFYDVFFIDYFTIKMWVAGSDPDRGLPIEPCDILPAIPFDTRLRLNSPSFRVYSIV